MKTDKEIISILRSALEIALMAMEQNLNLSTHIAANAPTIRDILLNALRDSK